MREIGASGLESIGRLRHQDGGVTIYQDRAKAVPRIAASERPTAGPGLIGAIDSESAR